ncbi:hypothetical protein GCM10007203_20440 [Staphylococcus nepalensis]|nr:hypothetical protein GCM10007203_20440 [Staphylococcus nepalensis]
MHYIKNKCVQTSYYYKKFVYFCVMDENCFNRPIYTHSGEEIYDMLKFTIFLEINNKV